MNAGSVGAVFALLLTIVGGGVWSSQPATTQAIKLPAVPTTAPASFELPPGHLPISQEQLRQAFAAGDLDRPIQSLLEIERPLRHGEYKWDDAGIPQGPVWVRIDLRSQILSVFRAGHEIGTAVILYGAETHETPAGLFPVLSKAKDHRSSLYDADMPYTLRLTGDGISIHGSNVRQGAATHGCIGLPMQFAEKLFRDVARGDDVLIVRATPRNPIAEAKT